MQIHSAIRSGVVTPSDSTPLNFKRLYVGGAGTVVVQHAGSDVSTSFTCPAGAYLDVSGTRVKAASTATLIVWLDW